MLSLSERALVDETILGLSVICSACVIAYTLLSDHRTKLRYRIVLGLIVNDFILAAAYLIPFTATLAHHPPLQDTPFCTLTAYIANTAAWTEELWTLSVSVTTYFILAHPLSRVTRFLEKRWVWLCALVWLVGLVQALIGAVFVGYEFQGEYCDYSSYKFSELILFVPKCICFLIASPLYINLFLFLRRPRGHTTSSYDFAEHAKEETENAERKGTKGKTARFAEENGHPRNEPQDDSDSGCQLSSEYTPQPLPPPRPNLAQTLRRASALATTLLPHPHHHAPRPPRQPWEDIQIDFMGTAPDAAHPHRPSLAQMRRSTRHLRECVMGKGLEESLAGACALRASLLMVCLPLANMVLFILSFIRLIHNLSQPTRSPILDALADWGIFSQGVVDALIYGVVEWRIRISVRKVKQRFEEGRQAKLGA